jgi:exodeoxyribonuclease VII small subunit
MSELENLNFEDAFAELESIVQRLEEGDLTLEDAMALFERGMALTSHCNSRLDSAELRVQQLVSVAGEYESVEDYGLTPFEESGPNQNT